MSGAAAAYVALRNAREREKQSRKKQTLDRNQESLLPILSSTNLCETSKKSGRSIDCSVNESQTEQSKLQKRLKNAGSIFRKTLITGTIAYALLTPHSCTSIKKVDGNPYQFSTYNFRVFPPKIIEGHVDLVKNEERYLIPRGFFKRPMWIHTTNQDDEADYVYINRFGYFREISSGKIADQVFEYADKELAKARTTLGIKETRDKVQKGTK